MNMKLVITDHPSIQDEEYIIDNLWKHNATVEPVYFHPIQVTMRNEQEEIMGGLVARTWWGALEIQYLWVHESYRKTGIGTKLMKAVESEAIKRGCNMAYVDTFSFQAEDFYRRLGYELYGQLAGYAGKHTRLYMAKNLNSTL